MTDTPSHDAVAGHFPEPLPCGSDLCDQDHDGPCWTCGERWPCTTERKRRMSTKKRPTP